MSGFYADDSQLYIVCNVKNLSASYCQLEKCVCDFQSWMSTNRLKLNGDKTELTVFSTPYVTKQIWPALPTFSIDDVQIPSQKDCKILGSFFDNSLSMDIHVDQICKLSNYHLSNIYSIRKYLDPKTTETLVHAFVTSRLDYCNSLLFGMSKRNISRLQKIQNRAARLCLNLPRKARVPSSELLKTLHWLPVSFRIEFKILLLTFKCTNGLAPSYLSDLISFRSVGRTLRSSNLDLLGVPKSRTRTFGDRAFSVAAPRLWNSLPLSLRSVKSVATFKKDLKTFLFIKAF